MKVRTLACLLAATDALLWPPIKMDLLLSTLSAEGTSTVCDFKELAGWLPPDTNDNDPESLPLDASVIWRCYVCRNMSKLSCFWWPVDSTGGALPVVLRALTAGFLAETLFVAAAVEAPTLALLDSIWVGGRLELEIKLPGP